MKVNDGRITSPESRKARTASCKAIVALQTATQCLTPNISLSFSSNSRTQGPLLVRMRRSRIAVSRAKRRSRSGMFGRPTCRASAKAGGPPQTARSRANFFFVIGASHAWAGFPFVRRRLRNFTRRRRGGLSRRRPRRETSAGRRLRQFSGRHGGLPLSVSAKRRRRLRRRRARPLPPAATPLAGDESSVVVAKFACAPRMSCSYRPS